MDRLQVSGIQLLEDASPPLSKDRGFRCVGVFMKIYSIKYLENGWVLLNDSVKCRYNDRIEVQYDKTKISEETAFEVVKKYFEESLSYVNN